MRVKEDPRRSVVNRSVREVVEAEVQKRRCVGMAVLEARMKLSRSKDEGPTVSTKNSQVKVMWMLRRYLPLRY